MASATREAAGAGEGEEEAVAVQPAHPPLFSLNAAGA
jgi:hypothetical protein